MQVVKSEAVLTPEHVKVAFMSKDEAGKPILDVAFTDEGLAKINELIKDNFGGKLNIIFKSKALSRSSAIMLKSFKNNTIRITSGDDDIQILDELKEYLNSN